MRLIFSCCWLRSRPTNTWCCSMLLISSLQALLCLPHSWSFLVLYFGWRTVVYAEVVTCTILSWPVTTPSLKPWDHSLLAGSRFRSPKVQHKARWCIAMLEFCIMIFATAVSTMVVMYVDEEVSTSWYQQEMLRSPRCVWSTSSECFVPSWLRRESSALHFRVE